MISLRALALLAGACTSLLGTAPCYANSTPASNALAEAERSSIVDAPGGSMKGAIEGNLRVF
jgi:hypothetical protein